MSFLFHALIYEPIYNLLIFFYNIFPWHDFGVAIIITTILVKTLLFPLSKKQIEQQKKLQEIQPKIKEIQQKHKDDKEKQTKELMDFYKKNKANPFGGCLPLVLQFIVLIAMYQILLNISKAGLTVNSSDLYSFVSNPGKINNIFLGFLDLAKPNPVLAVLAAASQFFQIKLMSKKKTAEVLPEKNKDTSPKNTDMAEMMNKQMLVIGPVLTLIIGLRFDAGLALYWFVSTLFMVGQQIYTEKHKGGN